jgi:hypothetical protein
MQRATGIRDDVGIVPYARIPDPAGREKDDFIRLWKFMGFYGIIKIIQYDSVYGFKRYRREFIYDLERKI